MPPWLMDVLYIPLALLYLPVLLYQALALKKNRRGWGERFGFVRPRRGRQPCVWIHAVSLGEVNATRSLVTEIERRLPDHEIVISATTDTGYAAACKHYRPKLVFRYPVDFSWVVRRVLRRIRPNAIVLMELEVWPNLVALARREGIPIGIANGRVTEERSMRRFGLPVVRWLARRMFRDITWTGAQNETYAGRFARLGARAERVTVTGSMKYDTALVADRVPGDDRLAEAVGIDRAKSLIVAGSTGPGEEEMLLKAYAELSATQVGLQLAIIPRKPERFDEVARLIEAQGFGCVRRSRRPDGSSTSEVVAAPAGERPAVVLGDTMGELRKFYALADVVFVGRSLVPMGGSDLMEVAGLGRAMCFGPYVENFADAAEQLLKADAAVQVSAAADLVQVLHKMLEHGATAHEMGRRAQEVVRRNQGATKRTVDLLCESLGRRADHLASSISTEKLPESQHSVA